MSAEEAEWWCHLSGDELFVNTAGVPPYDARRVAGVLDDRLAVSSGTVLDLGCGVGRLAAAYLNRAPLVRIVGVDIAPAMRARAAALLPAHRFHWAIPAGLRSIAGAYSVLLFQHIPHDEAARYVEQVTAALAVGARFVFQYVEGDADGFCSHQAHEDVVVRWCDTAGLTVDAVDPDDVYDEWRWVTAVAA